MRVCVFECICLMRTINQEYVFNYLFQNPYFERILFRMIKQSSFCPWKILARSTLSKKPDDIFTNCVNAKCFSIAFVHTSTLIYIHTPTHIHIKRL